MNEKTKYFFIILLILGIISVSAFWVINKKSSNQIISTTNSNVNTQTNNLEKKQNTTTQITNTTKEPIKQNITTPKITNTENFYDLTFAIQADPHMDEQSTESVYLGTLNNIIASKPAFLIDLGDTFMIDKLQDKSETNIRNRYILMKKYFDLITPHMPLYLVIGNHDGEAGWDSLNTKSYRKYYFPNQTYELNYYSFEVNNTLFVMLDPYSYTMTKPNQDGWVWTLGKTQYDWLKKTLEESDAKYKFIFAHQLVGGDSQGRGGIEFAKMYEWGGNNVDGTYGFDTKRPGWGKPIHQLFLDNNVNAFFHGHDHFYYKQELDGIIYQELPQPSHSGDKVNTAEEYGYYNGDLIGGSGFLRVKINSINALIEFVKYDGTIATSYLI